MSRDAREMKINNGALWEMLLDELELILWIHYLVIINSELPLVPGGDSNWWIWSCGIRIRGVGAMFLRLLPLQMNKVRTNQKTEGNFLSLHCSLSKIGTTTTESAL